MKILKTKYPTAFSFDGCVVVSLLLKKNKLFSLEANYFTILWWFFPYIEMNQPCEPGFEINTGTYILMCTSEVVELARTSFESQECFIYIYVHIEEGREKEMGRERERGKEREIYKKELILIHWGWEVPQFAIWKLETQKRWRSSGLSPKAWKPRESTI